MRIIGGSHRGTALASVGKGDAAAHLRPTTDRVRESLFNVLLGGRYGDPVSDVRVLDLFAGTGALGLEALSRGAKHVTFVENGRAAGKLLHENIAKLKRRGDTTIRKMDATKEYIGGPACDLVFLDPPYGKGLGATALVAAFRSGDINEGALIVWEDNADQEAPEHFKVLEHRRYGDTRITIMECLG